MVKLINKSLRPTTTKTPQLSRSRTDPLFAEQDADLLDENTLTRVSNNGGGGTNSNHMETIKESTSTSSIVESSSVGSGGSRGGLMRLDSQRSRRFSWEEIDDLFSAENIAKDLLKKCVRRIAATTTTSNKKTSLLRPPRPKVDEAALVPSVLDLEFFIKYMEYYELMQAYLESREFARARRFVVGSPGGDLHNKSSSSSAAAATLSPMSASSIYYSHSTAANTTVLTNDIYGVSPSLIELSSGGGDSTGTRGGLSALFNRANKTPAVSTLGSSSLKVKSAAYVLGNQALLDQLEKQSTIHNCFFLLLLLLHDKAVLYSLLLNWQCFFFICLF